MPSAYLIANVKVTNPTQFADYAPVAAAAVKAHAAEVCANTPKVQAVEGTWPMNHVMILKFPSVEKAQAFYDSPEYTRARALRQDAADVQIVIVPGL